MKFMKYLEQKLMGKEIPSFSGGDNKGLVPGKLTGLEEVFVCLVYLEDGFSLLKS